MCVIRGFIINRTHHTAKTLSALNFPPNDSCKKEISKTVARKRHRQQRQTVTQPKPRKIVRKITSSRPRRKKNANTVQLNLDPKSFHNNLVGPFGLKRNGIIPIPNDTPRSTMLPQLKSVMQSVSSPRLSVQLNVDTSIGSKTDQFFECVWIWVGESMCCMQDLGEPQSPRLIDGYPYSCC